MDRLYEARLAYRSAFGNEGPQPAGVSEEDLAEALERALRDGVAIADNCDWDRDRESNPGAGGQAGQ